MIMKKIFTLLVMSVMALAVNAQITIYVQAAEAPHFWAWTSAGNVFSEDWPGPVLTEKKTVQGTEFWYYTFSADVTSVSIIFNNGAGGQTGNITGVTTDRYFTYDGNTTYEDVTEQYGGVVPDAEVTSLSLAGNHNSWSQSAETFEVVEAGKSFRLTVDMTATEVTDNFWQFKICPNGQDWVGYWEVTLTSEPEWLGYSTDGNFQIDFEQVPATERIFTILATWGGGKHADENWTVTISKAGDGTGISAIRTDAVNAPRYDLSGRMVNEGYRGVVIQNGKKFVVK